MHYLNVDFGKIIKAILFKFLRNVTAVQLVEVPELKRTAFISAIEKIW
jgi:hypothetical protein